MSSNSPRDLSRTEVAQSHRAIYQAGWAYAHKSPTWHDVNAYGRTACGHQFNPRLATWCQSGALPLVDERCKVCEARRVRAEAEAAEQARLAHATRHQLSFGF